MKRKRWWLALVAGAMIFVGVLLWLLRESELPDRRQAARIAVVLYGENSNPWRALDQGIAQACAELGIERPLVSYAPADEPSRQAVLLRREVMNGVDGLLIAAADDAAMTEFLAGVEPGLPVVMLESGAGDYPLVRVDDANMARMLADECMVKHEEIAIVYAGRSRESVRVRQDAFIARMQAMGREPILLTPPAEDALDGFLASALAVNQQEIDCLVALDTLTLEGTLAALPAAMVEISLCGIGTSNQVVNALDTGTIEMLVCPNEYAVGYLGAYLLAQQLGLVRDVPQPNIEYRLVTRENMYLPDIERLIFPINQ